MGVLWHVVSVVAVLLGLGYSIFPKRIHTSGCEFLRRSSTDHYDASNTPVWLYRGLGVLFLIIGIPGVL